MKQIEASERAPRKFDLEDALLVLGVGSIVGGVAAWSRPAAAIVFGLFCLLFLVLIGRGAAARKETGGTAQS